VPLADIAEPSVRARESERDAPGPSSLKCHGHKQECLTWVRNGRELGALHMPALCQKRTLAAQQF